MYPRLRFPLSTAKRLGLQINYISGGDIRHFPLERARIRSGSYFITLGMLAKIALGGQSKPGPTSVCCSS
jgi:hypothetical protein